MSSLIGYIGVAAISAAGTAAARMYALRRRLVDEPGERRSHSVPTPRGGGAGPVLAILAWMLAGQGAIDPRTAWVAAALAAVALIGAWDDHATLPASWRLLVHVLAGIAVAFALVDPAAHPLAFASVVSVCVGLVNVWNFMDGINGIAASQATLVALAIAAVSPAAREPAVVVAVACIAFLPFNFPRARTFMGDVGSGTLGLAVGWLAGTAAIDVTARGANDMAGAVLLAMPLSAFLVDAALTLSRRMLRGERWWEPHTQHLYQRLAARYGHAPVTLSYAAWTALAALAMLCVRGAEPALTITSVLLCYTGAASLWFTLQHQVATDRDARKMRDP